jgi:hypothetical protein
MEAKIITHENNEVAWAEKYKQQEYQVKLSEWKKGCKVSELEKVTNDPLVQKWPFVTHGRFQMVTL